MHTFSEPSFDDYAVPAPPGSAVLVSNQSNGHWSTRLGVVAIRPLVIEMSPRFILLFVISDLHHRGGVRQAAVDHHLNDFSFQVKNFNQKDHLFDHRYGVLPVNHI